MPINSFIETFKNRVRKRLILLSILHLLERIGIQITPYYLSRVFLSDTLDYITEPDLSPFTYGFLTPSELKALCAYPETRGLAAEIDNYLNEGCLCYALKKNTRIVTYTWLNFKRCNSKFLAFSLKEDEAYFFRTRTLAAYRGQNLAPFATYHLHKRLIEMGLTNYYIIAEYFNTSAIHFMKKLKAKPVELYLYLDLFNIRICNITLKKYP